MYHNSNLERALRLVKELNEKYNQILVRLVCVSDAVLQEQLKSEHDDVYAKLTIAETQCTHANLLDMVEAHLDSYKSFGSPCTLVDAFVFRDRKKKVFAKQTQTQTRMRMRLRIPNKLTDRRRLSILCDALNYTMYIHDLEGYVVDSIGKGTIAVSVYIDLLSRFTKYHADTCYTTMLL